ncbi:hypothetical protein Q8A73_011401 [Channa argus]|nr:hypothetical protein Q8A73_011401 [Channa argus]
MARYRTSRKDPGTVQTRNRRNGSAPGPTPERCAPGRNAGQSRSPEKYPLPPPPASKQTFHNDPQIDFCRSSSSGVPTTSPPPGGRPASPLLPPPSPPPPRSDFLISPRLCSPRIKM